MNILVLSGGDSPEREVSIRSGVSVSKALVEAGYEVSKYDPIHGVDGLMQAAQGADIIFPILHGVHGEDGEIQEVLERIGKPYLGSDSIVSAITFDKERTHELLESKGVLMPKRAIVTIEDTTHELFSLPFVLKPVNGGSSVDTLIARVSSKEKRQKAMQLLEKYDTMLLEELIEGQEITVPVIGNEATPVILIVPPKNDEFDYENKYNGKTEEICPVPNLSIPAEKQYEAQTLALEVHQLVGARHVSRTDMILRADGELYVLEINTMPGMTSQSLLPKSASVAGMDMPGLMNKFIELVQESNNK